MFKTKIGIYLKKFFMFILGGTVISVLSTMLILYLNSIFIATLIISIIADVLFLMWILIEVINFRMDIKGKKRYYKYVLPPLGVYCAIAIIIPLISNYLGGSPAEIINKVYTFMFLVFKSFQYYTYFFDNRVGASLSAFLFSLICFAAVSVVPLIITKKRKIKRMNNLDDIL